MRQAFMDLQLDISTGEFKVAGVLSASALRCEMSRIEPRELLLPHG